jgi:hypothetical protein
MAEEEFGNIIYSHSNLVILKPVATQRQGRGPRRRLVFNRALTLTNSN